jgi:asparagine synthase (glutamine-hydrolysing)
MCGICGELSFIGEKINQQNILKMSDAIMHRGPDDSGIYCKGSIGFGHRRLSIIDLSAHGRQPMWSNDLSHCIVFNGEVYNYREIRNDLKKRGYEFSSNTDTEVVVNAIQCYGIENALSKFIGMFAFAIFNTKTKELYLCRDRAGVKPLYYYITKKIILFGSELKSLMAHPSFSKELNHIGLGQYFITGDFIDTNTVFKNTYKLSPGKYIIVNFKGEIASHQYWGLDGFQRSQWRGSFKDAASDLEQLLISAFEYRLVSDVPVGVFLSGGIDSSLLSSILKNKLNTDLLNITIGFNEDRYNEAHKAKSVSDQLGVRHITHYVSPSEAQDTLLKFTDIFDEPFGDTSGIPTYILAKLARQHVKVALSADGGDEQFCGYENYATYLQNYKFVRTVPFFIRNIIMKFMKNMVPYRILLSTFLSIKKGSMWNPQLIARYEKMIELGKVNNINDLIRLMYEKAWSRDSVQQIIPSSGDDIFKNTPFSQSFNEGTSDEIIDQMMKTDYKVFLGDDILTKVDRASMAVSLECRDPLLDHRIAELAFSLPLEYLYHNGEHKRILKYILRKWISDDIVSSPKRGFMIPLYSWLRGAWKPSVMEYLSKERVKTLGILDHEKVENEVKMFYKYKGYRSEKIWMMLNFQMWAEKWY